MAIIASRSTEFVPCPSGMHQAVCVDVIDHGMVESKKWGKVQPKCTIRWQVAEDMENGKPFIVQKRYTKSLGKKANLTGDLESWRGRRFTDDELRGFDLEKLLGANCMLNVRHDTVDGDTWANVVAITPPVKGLAKLEPRDYIREKDRKPQTPGNGSQFDPEPEDDIPF